MSVDWFCKWGYWVGPEGQIEPASGFQRHAVDAIAVAEKYGAELPPNPDDLPLAEYLGLGGDHHRARRRVGAGLRHRAGHAQRQAEALVRIVQEHGKDGKAQFFIDRTDHVDARSAMRYIRGRIKLEVFER